jgi:hypothetical protein
LGGGCGLKTTEPQPLILGFLFKMKLGPAEE